MQEESSFKANDLVAVRYRSSGTFGGMEIDWKVGIYKEPYGNDKTKHYVMFLPVSSEHDCRSTIVDADDIKPVEYIWRTLKGCRLEYAEIS